jgi:hypothetical protein
MRGKRLENLRHDKIWIVDGAVGEEDYVGKNNRFNYYIDELGKKMRERSEFNKHKIEDRVIENADRAITAFVAVTEKALIYICRSVFGVIL